MDTDLVARYIVTVINDSQLVVGLTPTKPVLITISLIDLDYKSFKSDITEDLAIRRKAISVSWLEFHIANYFAKQIHQPRFLSSILIPQFVFQTNPLPIFRIKTRKDLAKGI